MLIKTNTREVGRMDCGRDRDSITIIMAIIIQAVGCVIRSRVEVC